VKLKLLKSREKPFQSCSGNKASKSYISDFYIERVGPATNANPHLSNARRPPDRSMALPMPYPGFAERWALWGRVGVVAMGVSFRFIQKEVDRDYQEISGGGKSMLFLVASGTAVILEPTDDS
jgi:hypothetical protein